MKRVPYHVILRNVNAPLWVQQLPMKGLFEFDETKEDEFSRFINDLDNICLRCEHRRENKGKKRWQWTCNKCALHG